MNKLISHFRSTLISGLFLLVPVFVLILLLEKIWQRMTGVGKQLSELLGIKSMAGIGAASIATTILLLVIIYFCGVLVRFTMVTRFRAWLEDNLLQYIPGYNSYKAKLEEKLSNKSKHRTAVLVHMQNGWRPGILTKREGGQATVFIPGSPETEKGEVWVMADADVKEIGLADKAFMASLAQHGKGLKI